MLKLENITLGKDVDYNLLRELGELSGVNLIDAEDATQIEK